MLTAEGFRTIALGLHGAVERAHMGHPDFRANGRIFATLHADERSGTLKLTPEEQRELVREQPDAFAPAPGAWGRQGWTDVRLDAVDQATVRGALILAWQNVATPPPRRRPPREAGNRPARPGRKPRG